MSYRADIDGLRAVAVLLVLLFHFSLLESVNAGYLGVDIFYVISGYLITGILLHRLQTDTLSLADFYSARIRRLSPALYVVLLATLTAGTLLLFPEQLEELGRQILAAQLYFANFYFWLHVNYFGLGAHDVYLLHTWSLAVEEQFYLLFPVALLLTQKFLRARFFAVLAVLFLVSFGLDLHFLGSKPEATFYMFPTRAWELLLGGLIAHPAAPRVISRALAEVLALCGAGLILYSVTNHRGTEPIPGPYCLLPTVGTAAIILSNTRVNTLTRRVLSWRPMVFIGAASYSIYLVHWPLNVFAAHLIGNYSWPWRVLMFALSLVLAILIYLFVETPVRSKAVFRRRRALLLAYGSGLCFTVLTTGLLIKSGGLPMRYPPAVARMASYVNDKTALLVECEALKGAIVDGPPCMLGVSGKDPSWLIYGDSHAWAADAAFDSWLARRDEAGLLVFRHACPPIRGIHLLDKQDGCFSFNQRVFTFIQDHPSIDRVMLVSTWKWPTDGGLVSGDGRLLGKAESMAQFSEQFIATIKGIHDLGREVYVWEPVPGARGTVPYELAKSMLRPNTSRLTLDRDEYLRENRPFFEALAPARPWLHGVVSPADALCHPVCAVERDDVPLYFDDAHPTKSSAAVWADILQHDVNSD
jgi:peptidoglycan/LPS O-acetylase OafA/YrhL